MLYLPPCTYYIYILALHLVYILSHSLICHYECVYKISFGHILFCFFIYSTPCIFITYRSSHYNWLIFIPLFYFRIRNTRTNFLLVSSSSIWFLLFWPPCIYYICIPLLSNGGCPLHWDSQYDDVLHWAKKGSRSLHCDPLHSLWPVALTVTRCTLILCTYCVLLHSLWPVAL